MTETDGVHLNQMDAALVGRNSEEALVLILNAWEEGTDSGIAPELMAYAALFASLSDLVTKFGEEPVAGLVEGLAKRVRTGEFTFYTSTQ
ncbi:MAG TPA: hypothetical protein VMX97_01285 [Hyphomicrobiaceae bacterium]|nr:hypothetical protein [Hyphomicrobiaceae bacterium]